MSGNTYWQVILAFIMLKIKVFMRNPLGTMVYILFGQWYFMIAIAAIVVVYGVFYNLDALSFFDWFTKTLGDALDVAKSVAWNCTGKIASPSDMWECLSNPPAWEPPEQVKGERELLEEVKNLNPNRIFEDTLNEDQINPYQEK